MTQSDTQRIEAVLPDLRTLTQARVMLGRHGAGLPTRAALAFLLDHGRARQAVWAEWDREPLHDELSDLPLEMLDVTSQATDRSVYVRRPDLGRKLNEDAARSLARGPNGFDIAIVVGDGLSASAVAINAAPLLRALLSRFAARGWSVAPLVLASNARVALSDQIGELLGARLSIMLVGERPGLSAADSLGVYLTYQPADGTPDSQRNCISNIREGGLPIENAAEAVERLTRDILQHGASGIALAHARDVRDRLDDERGVAGPNGAVVSR